MKHTKFFVILVLFFVNGLFVGAKSLPTKAIGKPKIFLSEEMSWQWEAIAENRDWGELSDLPWKVYIDKDEVKVFDKPSASASVTQTCHFMSSYYVADIQNGYALLFTQEFPSLKISSKAKVCGWVSVDDLLLWTSSIRTREQVCKKAVIADNIQHSAYSNIFSKSPSKIQYNGFRADTMGIYYVFKETSESALLFTGSSFDDNLLTKRHGWMRHKNYINWNTRLCLEPNFGEDVAGLTAAIFDDKGEAESYRHIGIGNMTPIWKYELQTKRSDPRWIRFPILDVDQQFIFEVASLYFPLFVDSIDKDFIDYLQSVGISPKDIEILKNNRSSIKLKGYTSRLSNNKPVFTTSVFMSQTELKLLINSLESLNSNTTNNPRKDLQDALIKLVLIYIGQIQDPGDVNIDDLMQAIKGFGKSMGGRNPLNNINIKQLTNPNVVPNKLIEYFKETIAKDVMRLKQKLTDKSCYFTLNGEKYYYILVDDMPLQDW